MIHVVSLSGGKDSVALWLWAKRTGLSPIVALYADTGWEWDGHDEYLGYLERRVGPIRRCGPADSFAATVRRKGTFPSRVRRWCTEELKIQPFRAELDRLRDETGDDVVVLLGIRRDESPSRAAAAEREWADHYDCEVWRPILDWDIERVAGEHHMAGILMHPLYHQGAERVGCFPCVGAPKSELALVARLMPKRVDEIRALEAECGQTMFTRDRRSEKRKAGGEGPSVEPIGIDEVMEWAATDRGGRQLTLVPQTTGCARWGVCDASKGSK